MNIFLRFCDLLIMLILCHQQWKVRHYASVVLRIRFWLCLLLLTLNVQGRIQRVFISTNHVRCSSDGRLFNICHVVVDNGLLIRYAYQSTRLGGILGLQETNLSVMMPGDSIPSFLAKVKPHGSPTGAEFSELLASGAKDTSQILR